MLCITNLNYHWYSLYHKLGESKVVKMSKLLEVALSSYYPAFQSMVKSVNDGKINNNQCFLHVCTLPSTNQLCTRESDNDNFFTSALIEARDISIHLKALRRHFEDMEECDYLELPQRFPAMFHVVCLIWANSEHYRKPARLVVLLQEVSNLLITIVSVAGFLN